MCRTARFILVVRAMSLPEAAKAQNMCSTAGTVSSVPGPIGSGLRFKLVLQIIKHDHASDCWFRRTSKRRNRACL